jgi:hypothetical protein
MARTALRVVFDVSIDGRQPPVVSKTKRTAALWGDREGVASPAGGNLGLRKRKNDPTRLTGRGPNIPNMYKR